MSLFGKIKKLVHPEYEEPETAASFSAPSAATPEVAPGAIDTHCERTPFVILKDVMLPEESALLSEMLDTEGYQYEVVEYGSRKKETEDSDSLAYVHDRFYVLPKDLEDALDLAESVKEEIALRQENGGDSMDAAPTKIDAYGHPILRAPQTEGNHYPAEPGFVDCNCEDSEVILADIYSAEVIQLLSELLDAQSISFRTVEHVPTTCPDYPCDYYFQRFYVAENDLENARKAWEEVQNNNPDVPHFDDEDAAEAYFSDSPYTAEEKQTSGDGPASDDGDIYLAGTDFILIRQYEDREARLCLVRRFKEEGIPFTVTNAGDEPESVPFPGERVYVTADNKKKALKIAEDLDASADTETSEEHTSD